jgi:hypothetical protein
VSWLAALLSLGTGLITAIAATLGVRLTVRQQERMARLAEWSQLFASAREYALDQDPLKRAIGLAMLERLAESQAAGPDELRIIDTFNRMLEGEDEAKPLRAKGDSADA